MDTYTLLKYFGCKMTAEEETEVHKWIIDDFDGSRADKYRSAHMTYIAQQLFLEDPDAIKSKSRDRVKTFVKFFAKVAACLALLFTIMQWNSVRTVENLAKQTEIITVPAGERVQITLSDGTQMWMNSGTQVEVPVVFSRKCRELKLLEGEILLDVSKDASRSFIVDTWAGKVEVMGTRFDVLADRDENLFSTALLEGKVQVTSKIDPDDKCILNPNDIATMVDGTLNVRRVNDVSAIDSWSIGLLDVTGVPFDILMKKFEKAFDVRIFIDRQDLPVVTYTRGKIRVSDGIVHALSVLQLASDFSYSFDRVTNTVIIR